MKVFDFFSQIFAIFIFLTLGSLLMIVSTHILSLADALDKLRQLYGSPWQSIQLGFLGLLCIMVGLAFTKKIVKKGNETEAVIYQTEMGPIVVSVLAIEDVTKKVLKRLPLVKDSKIKTLIKGKDVEVKLRLTLWSGGQVPELLSEIQSEVRSRLKKLLGPEVKLEITCDVQKIEDHELDVLEVPNREAINI